jgi:hypothetical protein
MIKKSFAGVTAGVLLVGAGALATAQADPSPSTDSEPKTAAPAVTSPTVNAQADDSAYPGSVITTTNLLLRSRVEYRAENVARVVVGDGATDGRPHGTVTVTVAGEGSRSATVGRGGSASVILPRSLKPGRYSATASFTPEDDTEYAASRSGKETFTVVKSGSATFVQAARVSRGERPVVRVQVESDTRVTPRGSVSVRISTRGERHTERARLFNGQAVVRFAKVDRRGRWSARAVYGGSSVLQGSAGTDGFRVTR